MFLTNKTTIISKLEATPYDAAGETLADADFNLRIRNDVSYNVEIAEYRRKILDGTLDPLLSVPGRQTGTASFVVDMAPGAFVDTEPAWSKLLQACGFSVIGWDNGSPVAVGSAVEGISWNPHTDNTHVPVTLEVHEQLEGASADMLVTRFQGVMGNVTFTIGTVGEPVQMNFEFSGAFKSMVDLAFGLRLDPTSLSTVKPGAILGSTITVNGVAQDLDTFEFNMNNSIQEWTDPSRSTGNKGFYKDGFEPSLTLDPTLKQLSVEPVYTEWLACTPGAVSIGVSSTGAPDITLSAPAAQRTNVDIGDRNGARLGVTTFLLTQGTAGNDVFEILQGAKT